MLKNYYASIAIVQIYNDEKVIIESVSITKGECVLSGSWVFSIQDKENIANVVYGKCIISLGDESGVKKLLVNSNLAYLNAQPFLQEAKDAATEALLAYESFKSEDTKKRKKMVEPTFFNWPDELDFNNSVEYLESIGKKAVLASTPNEMKQILAAARLVEFLVDMWHIDEQERGNRKYVDGTDAEITILPRSWLKEFDLL